MNIAYIILAHKYPQHLLRLVERLSNANDTFFIHIDKKVDISIFEATFKEKKWKVNFVTKREDGRWGDIGIVLATVNALREIIKSEIKFDRIVLLSGMDYPIKSQKEILQFFTDNKDKNYITFQPFPVDVLNYGGIDRIEHYSINMMKKRYTYLPKKYCKELNFKGRFVNSFLGLMQAMMPARRFPADVKPYYGSQWWNITGETALKVIDYLDKHPNYIKYHKYSLLPDEMFFQSILLSFESIHELVNDNLRFLEWDHTGSHPSMLGLQHLPQLQSSKALFARKFEQNSEILDNIDTYICKK